VRRRAIASRSRSSLKLYGRAGFDRVLAAIVVTEFVTIAGVLRSGVGYATGPTPIATLAVAIGDDIYGRTTADNVVIVRCVADAWPSSARAAQSLSDAPRASRRWPVPCSRDPASS
jgi:hypothetical protein